MFTEIYIEALLDDEELADYVLGLLNTGLIDEDIAELSWTLIARSPE